MMQSSAVEVSFEYGHIKEFRSQEKELIDLSGLLTNFGFPFLTRKSNILTEKARLFFYIVQTTWYLSLRECSIT